MSAHERWRIGQSEVDFRERTIRCEGVTRTLSPRATDVLHYLAKNAGNIVAGTELLETFWPPSVRSPNAVQKIITELRQAFDGDRAGAEEIQTVPKRGYRLVAPVERFEIAVGTRARRNGSPVVDESAHSNHPSIAVLRFRNADSNPEHAFLADGLPRALGDALRRVPNLTIADLDQSLSHSIANESVVNIGNVLGVGYVLEGSVQRIGDILRISVSLLQAQDGERLYVYRDDASVADLLQIQDKIVADVLSALRIHLDERLRDDLHRFRTKNVEAYLAVMEGWSYRHRLDQRSIRYGLDRFRDAIALDPGCLEAYANMACGLSDLGLLMSDRQSKAALRDEVTRIREVVTRIDPSYELLPAIEQAEARLGDQWGSQLEAQVRSEIQQKGNSIVDFSYVRYADLLKTGHLFREASQFLDRYEQHQSCIDHFVSLRRQEIATLTGGAHAGIPLCKANLEHFSNNIASLNGLVVLLGITGNYQEAEPYLERLRQNDASEEWSYAAWLHLSVLRGDLQANSEALETALADARVTPVTRGIALLMLGEIDAGLTAWRTMQRHAPEYFYLYTVNTEVFYPAAVVNDARYQDFLEECGIGRSWTAYLRKKLAELAPITGIEPGDPAPQKVRSR